MTVSGFTFVRNGTKFDYPFIESISSLLPLCDEVVIAVGVSEDDTLQRIQALHSPKIRIVETQWDDSLRAGGEILAQQTNIALGETKGDWALYLQADELFHEKDAPRIKEALEECATKKEVEGLLFDYCHFYGSYNYVGASRRWYRREIRAIKRRVGAQSWGDAQGFRIDSRKLRVRHVPVSVYHYGWVKAPELQQLKQQYFNKLWHSDEWMEKNIPRVAEYDYSKGGRLEVFRGTHPALMAGRVRSESWRFQYDPKNIRQTFKERLLDWIENETGYRVGEYKNYELL